MSLKVEKIISCTSIFIICFIFHFIYQLLPNTLFSIFFPVNESIWEHCKLIFTSCIFNGIIEYILLNKFNIKFNNFFMSLSISSISIVPIFLIMYLPLFYKIGPKMYLNIIIMLVSIIISQIVSYFILNMKKVNISKYIFIILIIISYIIFGYLTYNPIKNELFFDTKDEKYGINNYNV